MLTVGSFIAHTAAVHALGDLGEYPTAAVAAPAGLTAASEGFVPTN